MPRPHNPPARVNKLRRNQGVLVFQATRIRPRGKKKPNYLHNKLQLQVQSGKKKEKKKAPLLVYPSCFPTLNRAPHRAPPPTPLKRQPGFPLRLRMLSEPTSFTEIILPLPLTSERVQPDLIILHPIDV